MICLTRRPVLPHPQEQFADSTGLRDLQPLAFLAGNALNPESEPDAVMCHFMITRVGSAADRSESVIDFPPLATWCRPSYLQGWLAGARAVITEAKCIVDNG